MSDTITYTVSQFCEAESISRAFLYQLWRKGDGPDFYMLGSVRRITHAARLEFQRKHAVVTKHAA